MLRANPSFDNSALQAFRMTLTTVDQERLDIELDTYAKDLVTAMLFESDYTQLKQMLQEKEISPLLFQWVLAVRESEGGLSCVLEG